MLPTVNMVLFMAKMSFTRWSKLDEEESRKKVTFMDREIASGLYDYLCMDFDFRFRNYVHNCPDPEHDILYRSDATKAL